MVRKVKRAAKGIEEIPELETFFEKARRGLLGHWRLFAFGMVLVGAIAVAVILWMGSLQQKEEQASYLLSKAVTKLNEANDLTGEEARKAHEEALQILTNLVETYGSTESGKLGLLYRGKCLSRLNRFEEAIHEYERFLSVEDSPSLYRSLALQSLGFAYQHKKEYEKALARLRELAAMKENFLKGESILAQAQIYEEMGKDEEAIKAYKDFLSEFPESSESIQIERRVAVLRARTP